MRTNKLRYCLSRHPIEERGGVNLYGMVNNNPISRWDYLGLSGFSVDTCQGMYS